MRFSLCVDPGRPASGGKVKSAGTRGRFLARVGRRPAIARTNREPAKSLLGHVSGGLDALTALHQQVATRLR